MSGDPLAFSKKACQFVTNQMEAVDILSLVAFDDEVLTVIQPSPVTHKDRLKPQRAARAEIPANEAEALISTIYWQNLVVVLYSP
jgi:hypothetical protein